MSLAVTGAATDSGPTAVAAGQAARTCELATRAAADARYATLPARTAAGAAILAARAAIPIGVAAAPAWGLLEDRMRRCARRRASHVRFSCRHRGDRNRCSNGAAYYQ